MDIVITDTAHRPVAQLADYSLDMAYGYGEDSADGENSFTLSFPLSSGFRLSQGCLWWIDGTEYGGVVDSIDSSVTDGVASIEYSGRTWSGVLKNRILAPDDGQDYWKVEGTAVDVLQKIIDRIGMGSLFTAISPRADINVSRSFRYQDAYTGIREMLDDSGAKLRMGWNGEKVVLSALPVEQYSDVVDSDLMDFEMVREYRPVNHLIGLGKGELKDRARSDWFADKDGNVSQKQSLFGLDEVAAIYDYSNAEPDDLKENTEKKLKELQSKGTVTATLHRGHVFDIGDVVTGSNRETGLQVTAKVAKKIITASYGVLEASYEIGQKAVTTSGLSGGAETSGSGAGGGVAYTAGEGIDITGRVISAKVTEADLTRVEKTSTDAYTLASGISADVGKANETANKALSTVNESVRTLNGTAPIHVWRSEDKASATVYADEATASTPGVMSAADKVKLDGVAEGATRLVPDGQTVTVNSDGVVTAHVSGMSGMSNPWPVGSIYQSTSGVDPANDFGGEWEERPSLGPYVWECVKAGNGGDGEGSINGIVNVTGVLPVRVNRTGSTVDISVDTATTDMAGLMSGTDKTKLDGLEAYELPAATTSTLGGVRPDGTTITVNSQGVITAHGTGGGGGSATPTIVTAEAPLNAVTEDNTVSLSISPATASMPGVMTSMDKTKLDGVESGANKYTLPTATTGTLGGVRPDGTTISVTETGVISATSNLRGIFPVGYVVMNTTGENPTDTYGGTWEERPSLGPYMWERTE
ncbi:head fiber protein [Bifidobacterium tissieri]|nr:head fiber protein [Bifidobacterium tissieri]